MRLLILSEDINLITGIEKLSKDNGDEIIKYTESLDPLDIMSSVCTLSPMVVFADDDYLKPNTAHILKSIKKVNKGIHVVFFTSDSSIELGREISPLGIHFYGIKPIPSSILTNLIDSLTNLNKST